MDKLLEILNKFPEQRVGVIGDLMLDLYLSCEVKRISQEAPVPIAKVLEERYVLGGAANVAANVRSLGGSAEVLGLMGGDSNGDLLQKMLQEHGIEFGLSFIAPRPTTIKTRLIADGQQMVRVDRESSEEISKEEEERILKRLPSFLDKVGVVVISDYAKGLITNNLAIEIIKMANERGIKVLSDPVPETFHKFRNSYLIKPNKKEAEEITGVKLADDLSNAVELVNALYAKLGSNLVITLGAGGMAVFDGGVVSRVPTLAKEIYDVSGAGDTVMGALALGLASGGDLKTSALISNYAAGVVVGKVGTATVSVREILDSIKENGVVDYVV